MNADTMTDQEVVQYAVELLNTALTEVNHVPTPWTAPRDGVLGRIMAPGEDRPIAAAAWGGVAEYVALTNPQVGSTIVDLLQDLADGDEEGVINPWALAVARAVTAARTIGQ